MAKKYLVITPNTPPYDFEPTLGVFLDQKRGRGYEVVVKYIEDFVAGTGLAVEEQIRQFVRNTAPACLLLVGDYNLVPGYPMSLDPVTPYLSDNYFGMGDTDVVPSLAIGRLPVTSKDELKGLCDRLLAYPEDPGRLWRRRVILAGFLPWEDENTDPDNPGWGFIRENKGYFDPVYCFESNDTEIQNRDYDLTRDIWQVRNSTKATLIAAIQAGATIVRYVGHGLEDGWYNIGNENESFTLNDIGTFGVGKRLPFVISATCLTGQITHNQSFAEEWLLRQKAIAVFASDEVASTFWTDRITQQIFAQIVTHRKRQLGDILVNAMKFMHEQFGNEEHPQTKENYRMFRLLGDPDTILTTPDDETQPVMETASIVLMTSSPTPVFALSGEKRIKFDRRVRRASLGITGWGIRPEPGSLPYPVEESPAVIEEAHVHVAAINTNEVVIKADVKLGGHGMAKGKTGVVLNLSVVALVDR